MREATGPIPFTDYSLARVVTIAGVADPAMLSSAAETIIATAIQLVRHRLLTEGVQRVTTWLEAQEPSNVACQALKKLKELSPCYAPDALPQRSE